MVGIGELNMSLARQLGIYLSLTSQVTAMH